jgi:ABC-type multidrug transport system ATPase subunit
MVSIQSANIGYKELLIENLSLELKSNFIQCISASNGIGKTCLARTITKFIQPLSGSESLGKYNLYDIDLVSADSSGLIEEYSGLENLKFYSGLNQCLAIELFRDIPIISRILNSDVQSYSSGMRQILKLLISLSSGKEILIWDEPFKSIAPDLQKILCSKILTNRNSLLLNKTLLVLDHTNEHWCGTNVLKFSIKERSLISDF